MTTGLHAQLGDIAEFIRGINFKPDDVVPLGTKGSVGCMRTKNVQDQLDCEDVWGVPKEFVRRDEQMLKEGDILISSANSWNLVGKCSWVPKLRWPASFGGFVSVLRANPSKAEPRFLYHWFSSTRTQALLRSFGQKTTNISNLNLERCLNMRLPLPPLPEQRRIAAILDKADALRAKRREALAQLDELTQSIFIEMFGDPISNPMGWPKKSLNSVCEQIHDCPHSTPEWTQDGVICLRTSNLKHGEWSWEETRFVSESTYHERSKRSYIRPGDIILSREGTVGVAAIVPLKTRCCMGQRLVQVRPDTNVVISEYLLRHLLCVLSPERISNFMVGSTSRHINVKELKSLLIPVPKLEQQQEFERRAQAIFGVHSRTKGHLEKLGDLFTSLQHRAFRGEL